MPLTPNKKLDTPLASDQDNVPQDMGELAAQLDNGLDIFYTTQSAVDSISVFKKWRVFFTTDTLALYLDTGTAVRKIGPDAVSDGTITAAKLIDNAVIRRVIADSAVNGAKIDTRTITWANIAFNTIGSTELAAGAVDNPRLATGAVTGDKVAPSTIPDSKMLTGTRSNPHVRAGTSTWPAGADGVHVRYKYSSTVWWDFVYDSSIAGNYKWKFLNGDQLDIRQVNNQAFTNGPYVATASGDGIASFPLSGIFDVESVMRLWYINGSGYVNVTQGSNTSLTFFGSNLRPANADTLVTYPFTPNVTCELVRGARTGFSVQVDNTGNNPQVWLGAGSYIKFTPKVVAAPPAP